MLLEEETTAPAPTLRHAEDGNQLAAAREADHRLRITRLRRRLLGLRLLRALVSVVSVTTMSVGPWPLMYFAVAYYDSNWELGLVLGLFAGTVLALILLSRKLVARLSTARADLAAELAEAE